MAANILTDRGVRSAKPKDKEYFLSDGMGLYLRVRPSGSKLWVLRYTNLSGRQAKKSLGSYPNVSLAHARELALSSRESLVRGVDPQSMQSETPATVQELFEIWMKQDISVRREARGAYRLRLRAEKHILPYIGSDSLQAVTRSRALTLLRKQVQQGHKAQANVTLRDLHQMFNFALAHEWIPTNRIASINKIEVGGRNAIGSRYLTQEEIRELWQRSNGPCGITTQCFASIWICLSTLARIEEMSTVEEQEVDLAASTWLIPAQKNKSNRDHVIHLSDFAKKQFEILLNTPRDGSSYLFKSHRSQKCVTPKALNFQISHRQDGESELDKNSRLREGIRTSLRLPRGRWSHHDLRRSGATLMALLGIPESTIGYCLNHTSSSGALIQVYQKQRYLSEQKEAFNLLGSELARLTSASI